MRWLRWLPIADWTGLWIEKKTTDIEDDVARAEKDLDKLTHAQEAEIDKALEQKEQELLEV